MNRESKKQRRSDTSNCYAMAVNNASPSLSMKPWWWIEWVEYASCKVAHKCLREWKCINKNAYICLRDWKRLQNPLIFAYRKKCLQNLLIFAYRKICLKNLLTKTCWLKNSLVFAWKQVFMLKYFRPLKVWRAGRAGDLAFAMSYYFLNCLAWSSRRVNVRCWRLGHLAVFSRCKHLPDLPGASSALL